MNSLTMIHGVKDVRLCDGPYITEGKLESTRDILITLVNGETVKIMCFMAKEEGIE
jgi:hypothetical protein